MARDGSVITGLSIPVPGIGGDSGSDAANSIVVSLDAIDAHDHTEDNGALITPAAMNINDTLDCNSQAVSNVQKIVFTEQGSSPTDLNSLYSKNDGELYFRDDAGNEVQLTVGGLVNVGGTGSLAFIGTKGAAGMSYASASYAWSALPHDSANGVYAAMNVRDLVLNGGTSGVLSIKPAAATSTYDLTLPSAAPTANTFLMSNGSGVFTWQLACVNGGSAAAHKVAVWESTTAIKGITLTDGQLLVGATGATPAAASLTGTTNQITVTPGTNSITLSLPQSINTGASVTFNQATLTTIAGSPTSALGNTTVTGTISASGNVTLTTMTGTGTRVAYVTSAGQFTPGVAAAATNTASTIMLRGSSGETAMGALTCTSIAAGSGAIAGGALTGSSLNVGSGAVTCGSVVCTGNVDGRDVSADGTKLDTITGGTWTPSITGGTGSISPSTYIRVGNIVQINVTGTKTSSGTLTVTLPSGLSSVGASNGSQFDFTTNDISIMNVSSSFLFVSVASGSAFCVSGSYSLV